MKIAGKIKHLQGLIISSSSAGGIENLNGPHTPPGSSRPMPDLEATAGNIVNF